MPIDSSAFIARPDQRIDLDRIPTDIPRLYGSKKDYSRQLKSATRELSELQSQLYADDRYSLLLIFQAMDAAGKDGAIKHVMSGINPQGCQVHSFKQPSKEELDHDFLWRTSVRLPERGRIGIFNRSYYEEVLVVRVHPEYLGAQRIGDLPTDLEQLWPLRFKSIADHEAHLHRNGTRVLKFYLHLSPDEQRRRFLSRLDNPAKHWKFSVGDIEERRMWPAYRQAYSEAIEATSTTASPWYVVPADDKKNARLIVSHAIRESMRSLDLKWPEPSDEERALMLESRVELEGSG